MGKKGKKTRWRPLPIKGGGGQDEEGGLALGPAPAATDHHRITFNEDEYTKITTPRQDVLFKKGYLGRKRAPDPDPSSSDMREVHSGDSVESESYAGEEPQYAYPTGYLDPGAVYYVNINGNTFETYDPYTGTVTVVVGPPGGPYPGAPLLAAVPCQPVPLQPVEWFNPPAPFGHASPGYSCGKRHSTDSQICSGSGVSSEGQSTGPPGSPQESMDSPDAACAPPGPPVYPTISAAAGYSTILPPQYIYPGYMFGPPIYNMNGMTVQGMIPQPMPLPADLSASKRRKKRRRRRRGGVTDDGSESSCCEEPLACDMAGSSASSDHDHDAVCQSGASSDAGVGPNSDSGINTNSGSNSPPLLSIALAQDTITHHYTHAAFHTDTDTHEHDHQSQVLPLCSNGENVREVEVITPEELSTAEEEVTPNLCATAPEFSSQESTLSCLSTPSGTRDPLNESEITNADWTHGEVLDIFVSEEEGCIEVDPILQVSQSDKLNHNPMLIPFIESVSSSENIENFTEECNGHDASLELILNEKEELLEETDDEKIICPKRNKTDFIEEVERSLNPKLNYVDSKDKGTCRTTKPIPNELNVMEIVENSLISINERPYFQEVETEVSSKLTKERSLSPKPSNHNSMEDIPQTQGHMAVLINENVINVKEMNIKEDEIEKIKKEVIESDCTVTVSAPLTSVGNTETNIVPEVNPEYSRFLSEEMMPLVPPPRRKKSICRVTNNLATKLVEEAIREGIEEATLRCVRLSKYSPPLSITEAVTRWLHSQSNSPLTLKQPTSDTESDQSQSEDEEEGSTGQKNVQGNPFTASSRSERVAQAHLHAQDCDCVDGVGAGEWEVWNSRTRDMCDPARSVNKYYRLGADDSADRLSPSVYKTAMHIRHTGPFPCGVCCIIQ